jgi:hypothetical protein
MFKERSTNILGQVDILTVDNLAVGNLHVACAEVGVAQALT